MHHLLDQLKSQVQILLIDSIESIDNDSTIIAIKNVSLSDPVFHAISSVGSAQFPHQSLIGGPCSNRLTLASMQQPFKSPSIFLATHSFISVYVANTYGAQIRFETERTSNNDDSITLQSRGLVDGVTHSEISFTIRRSNATTSSTFIHPTASVHSSALLGQNVTIGPYAIVNEQVSIGDNTTIAAHVMIEKWTTIGSDNSIQYGAVIGSPAQDTKYKGEESFVRIGNHNHIREYVTINRATGKGESTIIGSHNMLLTNTHIGHNCVIGDHVTMANVVHVGGHVHIDDNATIGGLTGIHQFVRIGKGCMIGGYSRLIQDIPPFMLCDGNPAYVRNLNIIGCRRQGMSKDIISDLKQLFKLLYRSNLNTKQALSEFTSQTNAEQVDQLINFIEHDTSRGISKKLRLNHLIPNLNDPKPPRFDYLWRIIRGLLWCTTSNNAFSS